MAKAKATPAAPSVEKKVSDAVDRWYTEQLANSVVSRDTDVHNLIHAAKPALVQAVTEALAQAIPQE